MSSAILKIVQEHRSAGPFCSCGWKATSPKSYTDADAQHAAHLTEQIEKPLLLMAARWNRMSRTDCDPANGSATVQAAGRRTEQHRKELLALLTPQGAGEKKG